MSNHRQDGACAPLFQLGRVLITPRAQRLLADLNQSAATLLARHVSGDWGELDAEDERLNERALAEGTRVFSAYLFTPEPAETSTPEKVWVITESDRSSTTILLPEEY